ncbi:MAG: response regulator [Coriobacteriales bacterium]|jgi:CheY-like chemotaxis protein|nr:response regulator [Coriobacteriales bacterium]
MAEPGASFKKKTVDSLARKRFRQQLLKANAPRMLVFCLAFAALQVAALFSSTSYVRYGAPGLSSAYEWSPDNYVFIVRIAALVLGVGFAVLFGLISRGHFKNPKTRFALLYSCLIILTFVQAAPGVSIIASDYHLLQFLLFLFLLSALPILPWAQSAALIIAFAGFYWGDYWLLTITLLDPVKDLISFDPAVGILFSIPAALSVAWLNFTFARKHIFAILEFEDREVDCKVQVKQQTIELKERIRVAEAANLAKARFLTRVSHEMRTSLTTIMGMIFFAKEADDPSKRKESLEAADQAAQKLRDVVANIIDTAGLDMDYADEDFDQDFALLMADSAQPSHANKRVEIPDLSGRAILIVEDLDTNRFVLKEFLKKTNATVEEAFNGKIAVEMFAASPVNHYAFIFMDLLMPEMNGYDATRTIRKMERVDAAEVPIVAVSANAFRGDIEASLAAGMDAHLAKPVEQTLLFKILAERLR